jgi:PadR family transcriptional regulator PadR
MTLRKSNPAFLNGVPEMLILKLLAERAMHGYDLVQAIKSLSEERPERENRPSTGGQSPFAHKASQKGTVPRLAFGEGCIYPILHRLEAEGLLKASKEEVAGRVRVVYRATARGKARLAETIGNWRAVVSSINRVLDGEGHGRPALA